MFDKELLFGVLAVLFLVAALFMRGGRGVVVLMATMMTGALYFFATVDFGWTPWLFAEPNGTLDFLSLLLLHATITMAVPSIVVFVILMGIEKLRAKKYAEAPYIL